MRLVATFTLLGLLGSASLPAQKAPVEPAKPVSVVVFTDLECPFSADLYFMLKKYEADHPGALNVTVKQSPIVSAHPDAPLASRAALAAGRQGKQDAMSALLYGNQKRLDLTSILADARQLSLDIPRFRRDLDSASVKAELAADMEESRAFGIELTPTLFIQGKPLVGSQDEKVLLEALQSAAKAPVDATVLATTQPSSLSPDLLAQLEHAPSAEKGMAGSPLTIIEFTDFQCPFCKAAAKPLEDFVAAHSHDVHLIVRSFPLDFHPDSELANEAALAAGEQGKYWQMHDLLFANQSALKLPDLQKYAQQLNLDMAAFDEALATHRLAGKIAADRVLGIQASVAGTPTFIVDGHSAMGAHSVVEWEQLLAQHTAPSADRQTVVAVAQTTATDRIVSGTATAPLTITWYTDVRGSQAPAQADLLRSLSKRYNGKVRVVFKAYPLDTHSDGRIASAALVAAASEDKFWPMYDALTAHKATLDRATILALAQTLRLNVTTFTTDLDAAPDSVQADIDGAQRRGILGAPVIFLNDRRVDGLQREGFYTTIADDILKPAPAVQGTLVAPTQ